jgi:hypothetical protein
LDAGAADVSGLSSLPGQYATDLDFSAQVIGSQIERVRYRFQELQTRN